MNLAKVGLAAVALAALGVSAQAATPIHQYTFNGNGNDTGSKAGAAATVQGAASISDSAAIFPGKPEDFVSLPVGSSIGGLTSATFEAWVTYPGSGDWQPIASFGNDDSHNFSVGANSNDKHPYLDYYLGGGIDTPVATQAWPGDGQSHHIAAVVDAANKKLFLYFDNTEWINTDLKGGFSFGSLGTTAHNYLGSDEWADAFVGQIDEFRIYDSALSLAEISTHQPVAVPEPASLGLLGLGALGLLARRRH